MATEAIKKAVKKYQSEQDHMKTHLPKGSKERYKQAAENDGKSLNAMVITAIEEYITNHGL